MPSKERGLILPKTEAIDRSKFFMTLNRFKAEAISDFNRYQELENQVIEAEFHGLIVKYFLTEDNKLAATFSEKKQIGFNNE